MKLSSSNNEIIILQEPYDQQNGKSTINQTNGRENTNNINKPKFNSLITPWYATNWSNQKTSFKSLVFSIYVGIILLTGVLVVCLTSLKQTDKDCERTFKRVGQQILSKDSRPRHVAIGDFNEDKQIDIVAANSGTDDIGIFIGFGNGTFKNQITYSTEFGSSPHSVAVGDFNNDKHSDIIVANYGTNNIGIFLGYGNGSFADQIIFSLGSSHPLSLAVGDMNNDNKLDIVVANYGTFNLAILLGFNNGSFRIQTIYDMAFDSIPYFIGLADINKDNQLDIAIVNYGTSDLIILLADDNGIFIMFKYSTGSSSQPTSLAFGDFNGDNQIDITVSNSGTNNIGIFLGYGNGTFKNTITYPTGVGSRPQFIVVDDFNKDKKLDIIVANSKSDNILIFKGDNKGTFSLITAHSIGYGSGPSSIAVADFDNNKQPDIVITNNSTNYLLVLTSYTLYHNATQIPYDTGVFSGPISVAVSDFNNDTLLDIVVVNNHASNFGIFIGLGNGTFGPQQTNYTVNFAYPTFVAVADINIDNNSDLIMILNNINAVAIHFGVGDGTFQEGNVYFIGDNSNPSALVIDYFNNDNYLDIIVVSCDSNSASILFGYDNGIFSNIINYSTGELSCPMSIAAGDLNNDTKFDFAVANYYSGTITMHFGYGDGTFRNPIIISTGSNYPSFVTIGDLNNDNLLDLIFTSPDSSTIGIILAYGRETFGSITTYSTSYKSSPRFLTLVDMNKDRILDIIVANSDSSEVGLYMGYGNGTFNTRIKLTTGNISLTRSIALGDFNADDQVDIVSANYATDCIGIFLIHYEEDFIEQTSYLTGSAPHQQSISIADFNNNHYPDAVVANSGNDSIQILLDYNNESFMNIYTYSTGSGSHPQYVTAADFNRDKQLDVAVANKWNDSMTIFIGSSDGTLHTPTIHSTGFGSFPSSIATGDINNDSWIDIVVTNSGTNNIGIFLGYNYSTFITHYINIRGSSSSPYFITTDDFNNDSRWDIAIANRFADSINICLGYGNESFAPMISYSTGSGSFPISLVTGDFNNDHRPDIAVANSGTNDIGIFLNYGNGTFTNQISYSTSTSAFPISIAVGYMNNDKNLDIIIVLDSLDCFGIFLGDGSGKFSEPVLYYLPKESQPVWLVINDFNNDNIFDIVIVNRRNSSVGILLGYGDATFHNYTIYYTGDESSPYCVAVEDFNKDGFMDLAVANSNTTYVSVFLGYGNGSFSPERRFSTGSKSTTSIAIGDLNNDAILDIVVTRTGTWVVESASIGILYGFSNGDFLIPQIHPTTIRSTPFPVVIRDFNNDGRADIAFSDYSQANVRIMIQDKYEFFVEPMTYTTGNDSSPNAVALGDFNNDNLLDIAVANSDTNNIGILLGNGKDIFTEQTTYSTGDKSSPVSIALADFNNDKQLDIVVANSKANNIGILLGFKNGTFASIRTYSTEESSEPSFVAVADLNKDNRIDIVVTNIGISKILAFFGLGNGTFLTPKQVSVGYSAQPTAISVGYFNNDTILDVAIACYGTSNAEIFLQIC